MVMPLESSQMDEQASVIDHDGRPYKLTDLIRHLSPAELQEVVATAPRSGQALWDEVVRRWPALAAEIVAGISSQDEYEVAVAARKIGVAASRIRP